MKAFFELSEEYTKTQTIDFNKKRYIIGFNIFVIALAFSIFNLFKINQCPLFSIKSLIVFIIGIYLSIILHELIHGLFIYIFSKKKAKYKFSFFYASAGAEDRYFDKTSYIIIALSPAIFLSLFLLIILSFIDIEYFNSILLILALSFSGAIGDFYISIITFFKPSDVLINDSGEKMQFFTKTTQK